MGIYQDVSNWLSGSYKVRTTKLSDNAQLQHVRLDFGVGTAESTFSSSNPLPVSPSSATAITTLTESIGTVTTSSSSLLAANTNRKGGYVQNISDTDVYISCGGTATTSKTLLAIGASLPLIVTGYLYKGALTAIHAGTGSKSIAIVELT